MATRSQRNADLHVIAALATVPHVERSADPMGAEEAFRGRKS